MDCIPYVNDLLNEINILKQVDDTNEKIKNKITEKEEKIKIIKENLSKMSVNSIEYRLYLKILNGKTPTQAVNEIADENFASDIRPNGTTQIWKYYKKIKKILKV